MNVIGGNQARDNAEGDVVHSSTLPTDIEQLPTPAVKPEENQVPQDRGYAWFVVVGMHTVILLHAPQVGRCS